MAYVHVHVHANSYMRPAHDNQGTSLHVRGGGDIQYLKISSCTYKNSNRFQIFGMGGLSFKHSHTLTKYLDKENLIKTLIDLYAHM